MSGPFSAALLTNAAVPLPVVDNEDAVECRARVALWKDGFWGVTCEAHPGFGLAVDDLPEAHDLGVAHVRARTDWARPIAVYPHTVGDYGWWYTCRTCWSYRGGYERPSLAALAGRQHWAAKHGQMMTRTHLHAPMNGTW